MSHETENGFGSGLRALIDRKAAADEPLVVEEYEEEVVASVAAPPVLDALSLQEELEAALGRERDLRAALEHQMAAYERERAEEQHLALRISELEQRHRQSHLGEFFRYGAGDECR